MIRTQKKRSRFSCHINYEVVESTQGRNITQQTTPYMQGVAVVQ
jgi:hypothetical protein